ncbi:uncharacterized protein LTR77_004712 [Saxophila tyrrhenica]|uniref:Uncharacterized protein n=1 Tax=Saxophila tyrrhenica TaxID=1690608 RepID=A0AAV9PAN2_9PEZI|nr:hypothetical protein LTR77_004712 [Saxophila tyrrhenica]
MDSSNSTAGADPPAYTETILAPPTALKRTVKDTRQLILANASMMRPHVKTGAIELVTGKTRGPTPTTGPRSFISTTSNVTIRIRDSSPSPGDQTPPSERRPSDSNAGSRVAGKHYAALVSKSMDTRSTGTEVIILGEPQNTVEEALEWMLDRTEIVITEMLANHRKEAQVTCCRGLSTRHEQVLE